MTLANVVLAVIWLGVIAYAVFGGADFGAGIWDLFAGSADAGKQPYFISMLKAVPFAMAGLWETWEDAGATLDTCTIITTAANKVLAPVHHRMPIVMSPEDARYWMSPDTPADQDLHQFLQSRSNAGLRFWPVSKTVNSPRNDGEVLIEESTP